MSVPYRDSIRGQFQQSYHCSQSRNSFVFEDKRCTISREETLLFYENKVTSNIQYLPSYWKHINLVRRYLYRCAYNNIPVYYIDASVKYHLVSSFQIISTFYPFYRGVKWFQEYTIIWVWWCLCWHKWQAGGARRRRRWAGAIMGGTWY